MPLQSPTGKDIELPPIRPNIGLMVGYRRRLDNLIDQMQADTVREIERAYSDTPPELAQDASPAVTLNKTVRGLARKWQSRFDKASSELASYFATAAKDRVDRTLRDILARAGISVKFQLTRAMNDAYQATLAENVALIRSIPAEHFLGIQGAVMRSVQAGRDLGTLAKELQARYGITKRRAALIARSQNNMATATMTRVRQEELGLKAKWMHSAGGRVPRKSHVAFSGNTYDPSKGAYIDGEYIWPGQLINCRCISVSILEGFS